MAKARVLVAAHHSDRTAHGEIEMNDIDRYLDQACRQVNGPDSLRAHLRKELKEHLEEAIDALVAEGMSRDDATTKAIEDLGDPEIVRDGMQSVYGPGVTSLFVEETVNWNNNRWHFAAQICLTLTIVLAVLMVYLTLVNVLPTADHLCEQYGEERPGFAQATIQVSNVVFPYRYLCLIAITAAFGFFEWMYKSENKTSIRTFVLAGLSLVSVVGAFWVAGVAMAWFALLHDLMEQMGR
jgi:hypothetical protein